MAVVMSALQSMDSNINSDWLTDWLRTCAYPERARPVLKRLTRNPKGNSKAKQNNLSPSQAHIGWILTMRVHNVAGAAFGWYDFEHFMGRYSWLMTGSLNRWRLKSPCPLAGYGPGPSSSSPWGSQNIGRRVTSPLLRHPIFQQTVYGQYTHHDLIDYGITAHVE